MNSGDYFESKRFFPRSLDALLGAPEPVDPRLSLLMQYRGAVEVAWADGELSEAELVWLCVLEREFGLTREEAAGLEREVMDDVKEGVVTRANPEEGLPSPPADGVDRYTAAVETAPVDEEPNEVASEHQSAPEKEET